MVEKRDMINFDEFQDFKRFLDQKIIKLPGWDKLGKGINNPIRKKLAFAGTRHNVEVVLNNLEIVLETKLDYNSLLTEFKSPIIEKPITKQREKDVKKEKKNQLLAFQKEIYNLLLLKKQEEATEMIVNYLKKKNYIYTTRDDDKSEMWIYHEGIYIPEGRSRLKEQIRELLEKAYKVSIANTIIFKIEADTGIDSDEFFKSEIDNLDEIPVKNGIYNLRSNILTPFNPKKIFFNKIPIDYNPNATCPNIEQHFKDVLKSEDDKDVMYELFGYLLWKDHFIEKAVMMVGGGRNGKTKTIELMKRFIGSNNCASVPLENMSGDNFVVAGLFGKMANLAGDLSNTSLRETGIFKQITGRDIITANRKFKIPINFVNYSKQIFACNELPKVFDTSLGFWSRWMLFEFPFTFMNEKEYEKSEVENKKLMNADQIKKITTDEELSGLFNMAVNKLKELLKEKNFSYSTGTNEIKKFWIRKSNSFAAFCMDHIDEHYDGYVTKKDLRLAFNKYKKEHELPGVSIKMMKITLDERYGVGDGKKYDSLKNEQIRIWEGIKFKDSSKYKFNGGKIN